MRNSLALLFGAAVLALASDVHELGRQTFDEFIKEHDLVLAECMSKAMLRRGVH